MSQRQVKAIVLAMLQDDDVGLRAMTERCATELPNAPQGNPGPFSAQFVFYRSALPGAMRPMTAGNVLVSSARWITNPRYADTELREGAAQILIGYEYASASHEDNVDQVDLVATALVRCMDGLRAYADAHLVAYGASVVDVAAGSDFSFGDFEGATTFGFLSRWQIMEVGSD
jgi:hypothetical protein